MMYRLCKNNKNYHDIIIDINLKQTVFRQDNDVSKITVENDNNYC